MNSRSQNPITKAVNADNLDSLFCEGFRLSERLAKRLTAELQQPEGKVRAQWVAKLINEYGYDQEQIALNVAAGAGRDAEKSTVFADIVAYRDRRGQEPFLVVETKAPTESKGVKQAESYARNLGADYHAWSNGTVVRFFRTAKYQNQSAEVGNIPHWLGEHPVGARLPKSQELPPFKDEPHLRSVVKVCHDRIFFRLGHDPAKAFDELMKLLFVKLFDERETPNYYEFMALAGESETNTADRINNLFKQSISSRRYKDVFTTRFTATHPPVIDLDAETITFIVRQFQGYSLVNTSATLQGADVKGTVFEQMVGGTFRGELGAYFTPREIVEFMVKMVGPDKDDVVLDPACGSGGFLIMTLKYILENMRKSLPNLTDPEIYAELRAFAEKNIFGTDINERMARVTKMNMIMHGDGHGGIFNCHGLDVGYIPIPAIRRIQDVTCIFSNPPFAGREADTKYLERFQTTKGESGHVVQTPKSIPFVEHILDLLKDGGVAALVLPSGIFSSQSYQFHKLRELIWAKSEILAIIGLPHWVFFHTGCDVQGALLFLRRTDKPRTDYDVFIDWAENVGYDQAGRKTEKNDLHTILEKYQRINKPKVNRFRARCLQARGRIDPLYYQPGDHQRVSSFGRRNEPLTNLLIPTTEIIKRKKGNNLKVRYLEVGDTDKETGHITRVTEYEVQSLPSRAKYVAHENMLLIPNHRNSIKAGRSVTLVPPEYDGIVATSRFIVARTNIPAVYLYHILNLEIVKKRMLTLVSGSSSTEIKFNQLSEILVPIPEGNDFDLWVERIQQMTTEIEDYRNTLYVKEQKLNKMVADLYV
ncbi:MAG: N-6 DNA methylase [Chloroflexi bacterium]|nr:N-6 DNA methylase [Chloroflexota bacterium]